MKSAKLAVIFSFIFGAATGAVGAWYLLKEHYEQMAQEEIDSVKETYKKHTAESDISTDEEKDTALEDKPDIMTYAAELSKLGYTNYQNISAESDDESAEKEELKPEALMEDGEKPYVISPQEYGELDDYEQISLTHYSDGTLADIHDNIIDDVDEIVGADYASHFGEYEDDSVFIRNDAKKCDYEILYDERTWADILESKPYLKEN